MAKPLTAAERVALIDNLADGKLRASDVLERYEATVQALEAKIADLKADNRGLTAARVAALRLCSELRAALVSQKAHGQRIAEAFEGAEQRADRLAAELHDVQQAGTPYWHERDATNAIVLANERLAALEAAARAWAVWASRLAVTNERALALLAAVAALPGEPPAIIETTQEEK